MARQKTTEAARPELVGVAGLGSMGAAIAQRLLDAGFEVWVTNRTRARADSLLRAGGRWAWTRSLGLRRRSEVVLLR